MTDVKSKSAALLSQYLSVLPSTPEAKILRLLIELGIQIVDAAEGSLLVLDEETGELAFAMTVGGDATHEEELVGKRIPVGQGLTGLAALTREVQVGAPTFHVAPEGGEQEVAGGHAVIAAPMLVADTTVGVITAVSFAEDKRFTSKDALLYAGFASVAGVIVEQRRRLAALEEAPGQAAHASGDDEAAPPEQRVIGSLTRIAHARPDALVQVVRLLETVEALVITDRLE